MKTTLALAMATALAASSSAGADSLVLLTESGLGQGLLTVDSATPGSPAGPLYFISGLGAGEALLAIDFRPLTGQLYGLGSSNAVYTLDANSGAATRVGGGFTDPLNGGSYGFDFNPVIDRIRIVSDANQNVVAHPVTGNANVAVTTPVAFAAGDVNFGKDPNVVHHAYNGNILGALGTTTQLRAIDSNLDMLVTQANNAGTLRTIGALGVDATNVGGFDIGTSGRAYAIFADVLLGTSRAYTIDLSSGAATALGGVGIVVSGVAVQPVPVPTALPLFGAALLALARRRRAARAQAA